MIAFETTARIRRPIDEVFSYVANPLNFPRWNSAVHAVRRTSLGAGGVGATYAMERELPSGNAVNTLEVTASERPCEFALRTTTGPTPFVYRYQFFDDQGETIVALDAEAELPAAASLLGRLARHAVRNGVDDNLASLKQILEAGRPA